MTEFTLKRDNYQELTTLGTMYSPDGTKFGYTLEDVCRPYGVKDKNYTAIPQGTYQLGIRNSPRYGEVVVVYTSREGSKYILENEGVRFEYILVHGGNNTEHTSGCILLAKNRNDRNRTIQGSLKVAFKEKVKELLKSGPVSLKVVNLPQRG